MRLPTSNLDQFLNPEGRVMQGESARVLRWHVVYLSLRGAALVPGCEEDGKLKRSRAEDQLAAKGFAIFRPQHKVHKLVRRRVVTPTGRGIKTEHVEVSRFLFPRYVFVGVTGSLSCWDIRQVDGVEAILCTNYVPAIIPHEKVEDLMAACDMGLFDHGSAFKVSRDVILVGVLRGTTVPTEEPVKAGGKVKTAVNLFGREHYVRVPVDKIKMVS